MKTKLLLVEDEHRLATVLKTFFEKENFNVEIVSDGEDALFQAESLKPDIILLDWMLPNMSGLEICRQIRSTKDLKTTPMSYGPPTFNHNPHRRTVIDVVPALCSRFASKYLSTLLKNIPGLKRVLKKIILK